MTNHRSVKRNGKRGNVKRVYNRKLNRQLKQKEQEIAKHNPPGSKAGPMRQWKRERIKQLLDHGTENELFDPDAEEEYGLEDALMEDLLGNTSYLTSQPTPEPQYLGHQHDFHFNVVADQMDRFKTAIDSKTTTSDSQSEVLDVGSETGLPSDKSISLLVRSYRDKHGTRRKPVGIVRALQHVLKDAGVPTVAFGEYTYNSLLTCCRTPKEVGFIEVLGTTTV